MDELIDNGITRPRLLIICAIVVSVIICVVLAAFLIEYERSIGDEGFGMVVNNTNTVTPEPTNLVNESLAMVVFNKNSTPITPVITYYSWGETITTEEIHYNLSMFDLRIDDKYQFENLTYNTLKSILVYHHVKYGLNEVMVNVCGTQYTLSLDDFFAVWDKHYPNTKPVRMTGVELEQSIPTPTPTPEPLNYEKWYDEVTYNESLHPVPAFQRVYQANIYGWHEP